MGISISDLSPKYQAQALQKYTGELEQTEKRRKYNNQPDERQTDTGKTLRFDSRKEARRFDELQALRRAGIICDLRLQADFTLQEAYTDEHGERVRAIRYRADFTYINRASGERVVEDVKSSATKTKTYTLKKKLLKERFGLDIREV